MAEAELRSGKEEYVFEARILKVLYFVKKCRSMYFRHTFSMVLYIETLPKET